MSTCPTCGSSFEAQIQFCSRDGSALVAAAPKDPLIGRVIGGRYRLESRLGRGGMGTVYRALHTRMDKPVAVKVLHADMAGDAEAVARFHREARSASRLDHENCIRVTDFGQADDGVLYLVMEVLDGESLAAYVARGPVPASRAAAIGRDVALALAHAHERGVIHRDLKADNVMLARRGARGPSGTTLLTVKVLDFGLAKIAGEVTGGPTLTRAGSVFGTPEYMAPEQANGLPLDERTDLYALGVLLYLLLSGDLPFRAASYIALLAKQVEELPQPLFSRRPDLDIPAPLEALVLRSLSKAPADRPGSAAEVAAALLVFADPDALVDDSAGSSGARAATIADANANANPIATSNPISNPIPIVSAPVSGAPAAEIRESSLLHGELLLRPRSRRWLAVTASVGTLALGIVSIAALDRHAPPPPVPAPVDPLRAARRLLDAGDLAGADRVLTTERALHDGAPLQQLLGELSERRGNRLGALAHMNRATRLGPRDPVAHAQLASLLHRLGHPSAACDEARNALALDPKNSSAMAASASCKPPSLHAP